MMHFPNLAAWQFKTARFRVTLHCRTDPGYQYEGEDEDGETQRAIDEGRYVAFDAYVTVWLDDKAIGRDSLCGCVYDAGQINGFWQDHRWPDPMGRNCSIMRAARGENHVVCHYFPDMVREAIREARDTLRHLPKLRENA